MTEQNPNIEEEKVETQAAQAADAAAEPEAVEAEAAPEPTMEDLQARIEELEGQLKDGAIARFGQ